MRAWKGLCGSVGRRGWGSPGSRGLEQLEYWIIPEMSHPRSEAGEEQERGAGMWRHWILHP